MSLLRRAILSGAAAAVVLGSTASAAEPAPRYGLIGKMTARPGQRDALAQILSEGVAGMPGCLSYVVAQDPSNPDLIWITEVWESKAAHDASLALPSVREAIGKGRPLIAGMETVAETHPVGGSGLGGR